MEECGMKKLNSRLNRSDHIWGWVFIAVPILGILLFTIVPVGMSVYISMVEWSGLTKIKRAEFVGMQNFAEIFGGIYTKDFLIALKNTFFMMLSVPIGMIIALLLAVVLNQNVPGKSAFRVIYYIPCIASVVAVTMLFNKLFAEDGVINHMIEGVGLSAVQWLYKPMPAKIMLIILLVWKGLGYNILLFLSGLQGVSTEYYEAAQLDGANGRQVFLRITLPLIAPMTFYILVTGVMSALQLYTEPTIMFPYTQGKRPEDGASTIMVLLYYQYSGNRSLGSASAIAWVLAALIMVVTALQFYINSRRQRD